MADTSKTLSLVELLCSDILNRLSLAEKGATITRREVDSLANAYKALCEQDDAESEELAATLTRCESLIQKLRKLITHDGETGDTGPVPISPTNHLEWVMLNVPKRRRFQSFMVAVLNLLTGMPFLLFVYLYFLLFTRLWPLALAYGILILVQQTEKHPRPRVERFRSHSMWRHYADYFPVRLVVPEKTQQSIHANGNYIFCYHPHGVHAFGALSVFGFEVTGLKDKLPGLSIYLQTLKTSFYLPFYRELIRLAGMGDASREAIINTLQAGPGYSVALVVGGTEEVLMARPLTNDLLLSKRKGFVRLALMTGSPIVPVYGFGENNVYGSFGADNERVQRFFLKLQKTFGFCFPLVRGRSWFNYGIGLLPHRQPIVVVIGEPVMVPQIQEPSREDIDHWHSKYAETLLHLYRQYQPLYDHSTQRTARIVI